MAICKQCGRSVSLLKVITGLCPECYAAPSAEVALETENRLNAVEKALPAILLTTETCTDLAIAERLDIVTAECVLGMNIFKDVAAAFRDVLGGRNQGFQDQLRLARKTVLDELRREAHDIGANAVIAVSLNYSEISGGGKSMLFLVATGTAVRLAD